MPLNILIISHNEELCGFFCRFLASEGHKCLCANSDKGLPNNALDNSPDLIIIEVSMPELTAIEIVNRLQRSSFSRHIPVIVISDFPELEFELLHIFDFICKPLDLARLREDLTILSRGEKKRAALTRPQLTPEEHQKFHDYLILHSGLHFERRNHKVLERGLDSRMTALRINSFSDYFEYLDKNRERRQELQKLLQFLAVGETFFFRYNAHFEALTRVVFPALIKADRNRSIRILSAGCSTGEEPYSIAMALMGAIPDWKKRDIKIFATDINSRSLRGAREGVYSSWKIRVTDKSYLERYFYRVGESYVVNDEVKSLVDFSYLNLQLSDQLPASSFDIIFCRNVMIYFTTATTKKVVEKFAEALNPEGYLFLGHSETLSNISSRFERHILGGGFYYTKKNEAAVEAERPLARKLPSAQAAVDEKPVERIIPAAKPPLIEAIQDRKPDLEAIFTAGLNSMYQGNYPEAATLMRELLRLKPDHTGAIMAEGEIHLMCGRAEEALECFNKALSLNDLLAEGYFLRGFLFEMRDRVKDALDEYRKAVLLKMDFVMPHYNLGKLYFRSGDVRSCSREFRNSLKMLEKAGREAIIPFSGGLSREVFLEQLRSEMNMVETALPDLERGE
ncbi:MAG TPA: CheR family methyltransferase [Geobacteraceae bacterium]|nr:CheR family methyltransferase [Geobacteraceae bacterium]